MILEKIKATIELWSTRGMYLPMAHDAEQSKPSVTLLGFYLGLMVGTGSVIALHFKADLLIATGAALMFFTLTFVFYKLRKLDKVKLDLDDRTVELEGSSEESKEQK